MSWLSEVKTYLFWRCIIAEFLSSCLYCFLTSTLLFNLQSQTVDQGTYQIYLLTTAVAIGFVVTTISYGFGVTHNGYIFPAVTFGQCLMRNCSFIQSILYFIFQMIGGMFNIHLPVHTLFQILSMENIRTWYSANICPFLTSLFC